MLIEDEPVGKVLIRTTALARVSDDGSLGKGASSENYDKIGSLPGL